MIVTVTYFKLRSAIRGFELFAHEHRIKKQLNAGSCRGYKKWFFWKDVYTMTMWDNEKVMREFVMSGAHKESMKSTARLGVQFKSVTFEVDELPSWKVAKAKLKAQGRTINYA